MWNPSSASASATARPIGESDPVTTAVRVLGCMSSEYPPLVDLPKRLTFRTVYGQNTIRDEPHPQPVADRRRTNQQLDGAGSPRNRASR